MKWFMLFIAATSVGWLGPFDSKKECLDRVMVERARAFGAIDPGFYQNATYDGICIEGATPVPVAH